MASSKSPLYMITWRCTRNCVGNCMYCSYTKEYAKDSELSTKQAYKMVDEIADFGCKFLGISGGEPLVREDIFDVIKYAEEEHGLEVSLITSGFAFDKRRYDLLTKYNVHTAVSIDGNKESNEVIRRKGSYDKAVHAMAELSKVGLLDCLVTTMTKYNIKHMAHPAALAEEYKARMLVYHNLVPVGRASNSMPDLAKAEKTQIKKGNFIVTIDGKDLSVPVKELNAAVEGGCKACPDFTSKYADISVGSVGSQDGSSTVIVRSEKGLQLLEGLDVQKADVNKDEVAKLQALKKKRAEKTNAE